MREDIRNILGLFIGLILEQLDPISSLNMSFHYFKVIFVDGQFLQKLPPSLLVVANHQTLQQQLSILHGFHQHLSKFLRFFFFLDDIELLLCFFLRSFVLFSDLIDPCLIKHGIGDVFDGVSFKLIDNVAQKLRCELLTKEVVKLRELFLLDLLFLGLRKWFDIRIDECYCNGLIIFQFHLF